MEDQLQKEKEQLQATYKAVFDKVKEFMKAEELIPSRLDTAGNKPCRPDQYYKLQHLAKGTPNAKGLSMDTLNSILFNLDSTLTVS